MIWWKKIFCGITTTTKRPMYLSWLIEQLASYGIVPDLFIDDWSFGLIANKKRCYQDTLDKASKNDWVALLMEDDVLLCENFLQHLNYIESQTDTSLISLFCRQRHIKKYCTNLFVSWVLKRCLYEPALLWKKDFGMYKDMWKYYEEKLANTMREDRKNHHDEILETYLVENEIPWTVSMPTLVEHIWVISAMKHAIGKSILFMDDFISDSVSI